MTERTTLARPYAEAVFRLARERQALKAWSEMLQLAAAVYGSLRARDENRVEAEVVSASAVSDTQLKDIAAALKKRLGRDIDLSTRIDPALIGGIVIRAGDLVIDGSVQGKLRALATH